MLTIDYVIQLAVMQPSLLKGETEGLSLFSKYNPHGIFIALEDWGYLMMSIAFLFTSIVFNGQSRIERGIRRVFLSGFVLTIVSLILLITMYGHDLEYRFECAVILVDWLTLIIGGILLSNFFRQQA
jgi:hypothetical protein